MNTAVPPPPGADADAAHAVAVVAFDRISSFHLGVPCIVFGASHPGLPPYRLSVCAWENGPLRVDGGFDLSVAHGLEAVAAARTVIVPSWRDADEPPPRVLLDALVAAPRSSASASAPMRWPRPACSTAAARRRTGPGPTISRAAIRASRSIPRCFTSRTAAC